MVAQPPVCRYDLLGFREGPRGYLFHVKDDYNICNPLADGNDFDIPNLGGGFKYVLFAPLVGGTSLFLS